MGLIEHGVIKLILLNNFSACSKDSILAELKIVSNQRNMFDLIIY